MGDVAISTDPMLARTTAAQPVAEVSEKSGVEDGIAVALSGGGYRAMLFHLGTLWRLADAGLLRQAARISSVSGGSITAGMLARAWNNIDWDDPRSFEHHVAKPIRQLASRTIDIPAVVLGLLCGARPGIWTARAYRKHLYGQATLQDLPDYPRFVINATNVENGALWRFSKPYMGDWKTGRTANPEVLLAQAVAASAAFPPLLSPVQLRFGGPVIPDRPDAAPVELPLRTINLADGGVYDNLGLETVWKRYRTLFVSDGGGALKQQENPSRFWPLEAYRALNIIMSQVRALRVRQLVASFENDAASDDHRFGTYMGIEATMTQDQAGVLYCSPAVIQAMGATPTALRAMPVLHQEQLVNWGYAICDVRLRTDYDTQLPRPGGFPYPGARMAG